MKLFGKIVLWLFLIGLLALFSWGVALFFGEDWPIAVVLFLSVMAAYFLFKFLRRMILLLRSRSKLAQQSAVSQRQIDAMPEVMLSAKWKAAIATLRASNLKRLGNPLSALPWYLMIGPSGTGKTSALARARLAAPLQSVDRYGAIEATINCDWWYFERAVVLDCAGRYVEAAGNAEDCREWTMGLDLLGRYRGRHGIDGLVLAISAERLSHPDRDGLMAEGQVVRERIEQLIRMFGKRFPIYVLVTQCDRLYGMEEWARQLPSEALQQALGYLSDACDYQHEDEHEDARSEQLFLDAAFDSIDARLQDLRLDLVMRSPVVAPGLLLFPNELAQQKIGLQIFLKACMARNPYLETPFLRGLFFSSARQQGGAASLLLDAALLPPGGRHADADAGLFLHDFFDRILPQDQAISRPAALRNHWRTVTQHYWVSAWLLICLAGAIFATLAFTLNMQTLAQFNQARPLAAVYSGVLEHDAATLLGVSTTLQLLEHRSHDWKTAWMARSTNIDDLERQLKQHYVAHYRQYIAPIMIQNGQDDGDQALAAGASDAQLAGLLRNLTRSINLLQARRNGADLADLQALPQPLPLAARYTPQLSDQLNRLRLADMVWAPDAATTERIAQLQTQLERGAYRDPQMTWLVGLLSDQRAISDVNANDFWHGSAVDVATTVAPAFTRAGKQAIDQFLDQMRLSVHDVPTFLLRRAAFENWYQQQRLQVWQQFIVAFPDAERSLVGEVAWRAALGHISGIQSPYYRLLDRLNAEFDNVPQQSLPSWLQLTREFVHLHQQMAHADERKLFDAINSVGAQAVQHTLHGAPEVGRQLISDNLNALDATKAYLAKVNQVAAATVKGQGNSYQLAADFHAFGRPGAQASLVYEANASLLLLKQLLGHHDAADDAVWRLIGAPLHFVLTYTEQQASCELQKEWQSTVRWPLQTALTPAAIVDQLYGEKGSVWAFVDGVAKPFLERDAKRFNIVQTLGYSVPLSDAFLPMLNRAMDQRVAQTVSQQRAESAKAAASLQAQQRQTQIARDLVEIDKASAALTAQSFAVKISAQPTNVNAAASAKPFSTLLSMQGAAFQLNNFNFPVSASLVWQPGQASALNLEIKIDTLVLRKHYASVPAFLRDFSGGMRQFSAADFPQFKVGLDALKVTQIGVHYGFEGGDALLRAAQQFEALTQRKQQALSDQQRLQDAQFAAAEQSVASKAVLQVGGAGTAALPQQIGMCWSAPAPAPAKMPNALSAVPGV